MERDTLVNRAAAKVRISMPETLEPDWASFPSVFEFAIRIRVPLCLRFRFLLVPQVLQDVMGRKPYFVRNGERTHLGGLLKQVLSSQSWGRIGTLYAE